MSGERDKEIEEENLQEAIDDVLGKKKTTSCIYLCCWDIPLFRNPRFRRALLSGSSIMLAFAGWLIFLFEFIEYDPPVAAWVPGIMSSIGFVALNLGHIPDESSGVYHDQRMNLFEMFFVASLAWTMFPVVISLFIMAIDYKHESEHTVAVALFFQTTCIFASGIALMASRSMDVRAKKNEDYDIFPII